MRFKITFDIIGENNILPINYQYELSSWIYKILDNGNPEFSNWLHNIGYINNNKRFKLFTFSKLYINSELIHNNINGEKDRLKIKDNNIECIISFHIEEAIETFIIGIFSQQQFTLGDRISTVLLQVKTVEKINEPEFKEEMIFETISPIVVCKNLIKIYDEKKEFNCIYLSPEDINYEEFFINNMISKYISIFDRNNFNNSIFESNEIKFEAITKSKSKLITIKSDTTEQSKVKGFMFNFKLIAPKELMKLCYNSGFGEKNSMGFGFVNILK